LKKYLLDMVIANSVKTSTPNYVIADISLSDFGRKEIKIAEKGKLTGTEKSKINPKIAKK